LPEFHNLRKRADMAGIEFKSVTGDEAGMRLDRWFKTHFPGLGFGQLQKLVRTGQVRVDGARVKTSTRVAAGQSVRVPPLADDAGQTAKPQAVKPGGDDRAFLQSITLHEDRYLLVLNKPAGLAVQGGSGVSRHVDGLLEALRDKSGQKPRLVHRLDRDTAGVLVVAKTRSAASQLAKTFRSREAQKVYWALVAGVPKPARGRISTFLAKEEGPEGDRMRITRQGSDGASHAVTFYSIVDQVGQKLAWLMLKPVTGRTHQLRAHCDHIGHPIVGDPKYFQIENWELPGGIQKKLHLLARRIVIPHPAGGMLDVTAPLPPHMVQSWNLLGFNVAEYQSADELDKDVDR